MDSAMLHACNASERRYTPPDLVSVERFAQKWIMPALRPLRLAKASTYYDYSETPGNPRA
jgi:hypothetical protein